MFGSDNLRYNTVIFDLDGVLIDSIAVTRQAFFFAYNSVVGRGDPPFAEYCKHLGRAFPDVMKTMGLPLEMWAPFVAESNRLTPMIVIFDEVVPLLGRMSSCGINMGVATGKDGKRARGVLGALGLLEFFGLVVGSDEVVCPKPAPDMIEKHLRYFGSPRECALVVGDSLSDLAAGRAAGVDCAAALWGDGCSSSLRAARPEHLLSCFSDLEGVVCGGPTSTRLK